MTDYDPSKIHLANVATSIERLKQFLHTKYGMGLQDLYMHTPAMKPIIEFFTMEVDELNARVGTLEAQLSDDTSDDINMWQGF